MVKETYEQLKIGRKEPPGRIDLNPEQMKWETEGKNVPFNLPPNMTPTDLENLPQIRGFVPVIHQIIPIHNLPLLLGEKEELPVPQLSQL